MKESITLYKEESYGDVNYALEIIFSSDEMPDLDKPLIRKVIHKGVEEIKAEVLSEIKSNDPNTLKHTKENRKVIDIFGSPIFVEEIPNGYCGDWCCRHLPWFVVTTHKGRFKIGWRKRVIKIDWSETIDTETSENLFEDEDVTKGRKYIHAWSLVDAKRYVDKILKEI